MGRLELKKKKKKKKKKMLVFSNFSRCDTDVNRVDFGHGVLNRLVPCIHHLPDQEF
jgi:hypothetical protein